MSVQDLQAELEKAKRQVVTDGYEMSLGEIASLYKNGELIIAPAYQRLIRWEESQKTRFVESILLGLPVPPVFVFQREDGVWELIDGLQRISTALHLMGVLTVNGSLMEPLVLSGTNFLPSLEGMKWSSSQPDDMNVFNTPLQLEIKRARIRVEILRKESDHDAKYELFQRLNTGGSKLSDQEVRNSVLVMLNENFFQWIRDRSTKQEFKDSVQLTPTQEELAQDNEMVLRFVAYRRAPYAKGLDVNEYLDLAARKLCSLTAAELTDETDTFNWTFELLWNTFSGDAFRRWDGNRHTGRSMLAAFDVITFGMAENRQAIAAMPNDVQRQGWLTKKSSIFVDRPDLFELLRSRCARHNALGQFTALCFRLFQAMKIRSTEELMNYLDDDLAWRRKEVIELRSIARTAKAKKADVHVRAGVAMLYAHWEGFVKNASNAYVVFVSALGMKTRELQDSFVALSIKTKLTQMGDSGKSSVAVPAIAHLMSVLDKPASLPVAGITADGNLKSEVFVNIAGWLGLDVARYSARFNLIDETLLASRNKIAHGEYLNISPLRFDSLAEEILELMEWFKTDLENAAACRSFQRKDNLMNTWAG